MRHRLRRLHLRPQSKRGALLLVATILSFASVIQIFQAQSASADQLTPRSVRIGSSQSALGGTVGTGVGYDFSFTWTVNTPVQGLTFQFCTTPLGTCVLPNLMDVSNDLVSLQSQTGFPANGTAFTEQASNTGSCNDTGTASTVTMYCLTRSAATASSGTTNVTVNLDDIKNPTLASGNYLTVFVRIGVYSDTAFATRVHDGTVATAIVRQLTTTGRVQERLEFCVAALGDTAAQPADCAAFPSTTTVDLGIIDNASVAISPVDLTATNPGNDSYGAMMVNTNASGGVLVDYFSEPATNVSSGDTDQLRAFRVLPTNCAALATTFTDQCFRSAGTTKQAITANNEWFGLYVACVVDSTGITDGNLSKSAFPNNAIIHTNYTGEDGDITEAADCENEPPTTAHQVSFQDSGATDTLVESTGVVDHEMLKVRFAASAAPTTPTGQYVVVTTYIAIPTF